MQDSHDPSSGSHARSSRPLRWDALSDVLRTVRLTGALFFQWNVTWPYAQPVPRGRRFAPVVLPGAQEIISYHIVTDGDCWGGLVGGEPMHLEAGDILLVPRGDPYVIASSEQGCLQAKVDVEAALGFYRQMAAGELPFEVLAGGGGETSTRLVCGFLGCDVRPFNPVLGALPPLVRLRRPADPGADRLQWLIDYTLAEARQPRAGGQSVLVRLSELLFVEVVRRCLAQTTREHGGWLEALRDPVAGRALMLLHREPAAAWTVESLAAALGVSRSRLAESFARRVGQPPMQYLARWRMQLAARELADGAGKVAAVARDVGYESEAAFSRAFKRLVGVSPAQWRRESSIAARTPDGG